MVADEGSMTVEEKELRRQMRLKVCERERSSCEKAPLLACPIFFMAGSRCC